MSDVPDVRLSVLDISPVFEGSTATDALRETIELARRVEEMDYYRFWVAEHHAMRNIASCSPPVLIGRIADATTRMRVGAGGVMLANHAPLVVAEQFGTLEALHPGRIDLGVGRAPGTDPGTARALRRVVAPGEQDDFPQRLVELMSYFEPAASPDSAAVLAVPAQGARMPTWLLGTSGYSARMAGMLGLPFAFAHHLAPAGAAAALDVYRTTFHPSPELERPYAILAAMVIAADSDERARWLAGPMALTSLLHRTTGMPGLHPTPEQAARRSYTAQERRFIEERLDNHLVGGPDTIRRRVGELVRETGADELMALGLVHGLPERVHSFRLLADAVRVGAPAVERTAR
ncbi:LLM class flavin-dependent oxidoreductase [Embleya sp. NPDC055664]